MYLLHSRHSLLSKQALTIVCLWKKRKGHKGVCAKKEEERKKNTGWLKENQDYACPRYGENSNETEQR